MVFDAPKPFETYVEMLSLSSSFCAACIPATSTISDYSRGIKSEEVSSKKI